MMRWLIGLLVIVAAAGGGFYVAAGRAVPPTVQIEQPGAVVGQAGSLVIVADGPGASFSALVVAAEQDGKTIPLFDLTQPGAATLLQEGPNRLRVTRPFGKASVPDLKAGTVHLTATVVRKALFGLKSLTATATHDVTVRLEPPRIAVVSTHHYVNHGGAELVVYKATPPDVRSGVRVGEVEYIGYPAAGAGLAGADPSLKVAVFALLHDQEMNTPIVAFARDEAGNEAKTRFIDNAFPKPFKRSRIPIDDRFLQRVVPEILEHSPDFGLAAPASEEEFLPAFLKINGELRQKNADTIAALVAKSSASRLWKGPFVQLGNSQVEASFADHRTYLYKNKEVDQQVHLGFDLAVTSKVAVVAANDGVVLNASWLGIYGNCIIVDHGLGVMSLYGHLSSFDVKVGDTVTRGQTIGRSGMTGLAGGDHLHFTMLVGGHAVNPVEWWDSHWMQDRVDRKMQEAGAPATAEPAAAQAPVSDARKPRAERPRRSAPAAPAKKGRGRQGRTHAGL